MRTNLFTSSQTMNSNSVTCTRKNEKSGSNKETNKAINLQNNIMAQP